MEIPSPYRVELARKLLGLTLKEAAEITGISHSTLSLLERGDKDATPYILELSGNYGQPTRFFYRERRNDLSDPFIAFRSLRTTREKIRSQVIAKRDLIVCDIDTFLQSRIPFREVSLTEQVDVPSVHAALETRKLLNLGLGPLHTDLIDTLENQGVRFYWYRDLSSKTSAFSFWYQDVPYIFINSDNQSAERDNFTIAHELGHLLLHRDAHNDETVEIENEANEFAQAFLMPPESFSSACPSVCSLEHLQAMKVEWRCSMRAIVRRMYALDRISEWQYHYANKTFNQRKWIKSEPLDRPAQRSELYYNWASTLTEQNIKIIVEVDLGIAADSLEEAIPPVKIVRNSWSLFNF